MAFDQSTRNRLARFVGDARRILTDEFTRQCNQDYGIDPDTGEVSDLSRLTHLNDTQRATARILRETIDHYVAAAPSGGNKASIDRIIREQAFTTLNRLCAVRMAEARGIVIESVSKGPQSKGFLLYARVAGSALGETADAYRCYLFSIFDEIALDLPPLFDRFSPKGRLFPSATAFDSLLAEINHVDLDPLWGEDETIGWLYQYFNNVEERKQMREESAAPRNSRELAVRNQFFTPRYVVEFLTDNTLGRIWYEMTQGCTVLKDTCRYLVLRPNEIFLPEGEEAPKQEPPSENLSQEELLRQPVHVPHRPLKDPRQIRLLDPACGSMHFGLYAFDLFTTIYDEAWELTRQTAEERPASASFNEFVQFASTFQDKGGFLLEVPRLIIEHNIHGIDIDPRAVQIAGLSLWLLAQRAWHRAGVRPAERPQITRSQIVCAEPMPGENAMLQEFVQQQFPAEEQPAFGFLLEQVFDQMKLAGEAGSLLRIDQDIRTAIAEAKRRWKEGPKYEQSSLFPEAGAKPGQGQMRLDLSGITDEQFWERAEHRIYDALSAYAEKADNGVAFRRGLFANDAAQGFAFIDLCRNRYDVMVMNPPFGERSAKCERYFQTNYPETIGDLLSMFFERALCLTNTRGKVGAITNRTWLSLPTFEGLRTRVFGPNGCVEVAADLGSFVLDAQVETATAIIGRDVSGTRTGLWVRLLKTKAKNDVLLRAVSSINDGRRHESVFLASQQQFLSLPASVYGYWMSGQLISLYRPAHSIARRAAEVKQGTATADDFRFLRLAWELPSCDLGLDKPWLRFAKGGEYTPFFDDVHLTLRWKNNGEELIAWGCGRPQNTQYFGRAGVTWPLRTTSAFGPRPLPGGCAFGHKGPAAFPTSRVSPTLLLGLLASRPARLLLSVRLGAGDDAPGSASKSYEVGLIRDLPFPDFSPEQLDAIESATARCVRLVQSQTVEDDETTAYFVAPVLAHADRTCSIRTAIAALVTKRDKEFIEFSRLSSTIDDAVCEALGFVDTDRTVMWEELERPVTSFDPSRKPDTELFKQAYLTKDAINGEALPGGIEAENDVRVQTQRKRQSVLRSEERICRLFEIAPSKFAEVRQELSLLRDEDVSEAVEALVQYLLGSTFGRWDITYATGERSAPELPDPFAPLPVCPPGMLQGDDKLPLSPETGRRLRAEGRYPLDVAWDGILVDDAEHPLDLERRLHAALAVLWGDRADALEHEACALLGVPNLREWFRRPVGFFADHLQRYSKSRRQAPIYWPLSAPSGCYTLWLYYHRLSDQTLFTAVNEFVEPKIRHVSSEVVKLRGRPSRSSLENAELERLSDMEVELGEFRDELLRLAKIWKPHLNDGVVITAAPLWKLFQLKPWQKKLKETWEALEAGEYDWAHLAYSLWPDRVREKCKHDKSLAIAHGLEELYQEAPTSASKRRGPKPRAVGPELLEEVE